MIFEGGTNREDFLYLIKYQYKLIGINKYATIRNKYFVEWLDEKLEEVEKIRPCEVFEFLYKLVAESNTIFEKIKNKEIEPIQTKKPNEDYFKRNKDKILEYRKENKMRLQEYQREYRIKNKEKLQKYQKERYQKSKLNPEK